MVFEWKNVPYTWNHTQGIIMQLSLLPKTCYYIHNIQVVQQAITHVFLSALTARYQLEFTAEIGNFKGSYYHLAEGWMAHHVIRMEECLKYLDVSS